MINSSILNKSLNFIDLPPKASIIVGLSGGVDSAVSALLLKEQGYKVEGVFMKNWEEDDSTTYCSAAEDLAEVRAVCAKLDIKLHTVNFAEEYWQDVFQFCLEEFQRGRTPNPDILCNREIKFKAFLKYAQELGAAALATGHYAINYKNPKNENHELHQGHDANKDQSYFLYTLNQSQLAYSIFPIGHLTKPEVRALAKKAGLNNHAKKDSTGICFIGERKFKNFLQQYLRAVPGSIQSVEGKTLGQHEGLCYYTIGQRQGLKIGGNRSGNGEAWYVVSKNLEANILIVAQGHHHPALYASLLNCKDMHWISSAPAHFPFLCQAKIRYRQFQQACEITPDKTNEGIYQIHFSDPQRAITSGQSIVFYQGTHCLGGGLII